MESSFYSYGILTLICTLMIVNDLRRRVFAKDEILYRIKNTKKMRMLFYALGLSIPVVIVVAAIALSYDLPTRLLVFFMGIEMAILWTIMELGDALITQTSIGKVWFTQVKAIEYYQFTEFKKDHYLILKKTNAKRSEMIQINFDDQIEIEKIMKKMEITKKASK